MIDYLNDNGYLEGIVRGYRGSLLSVSHYDNLCHSENLDDLRVQLAATDYGDLLAGEPKMDTHFLKDKLQQRYVAQFRYLKDNSGNDSPMRQLLEYIQYGYMIDNVILLLAGTAKLATNSRAEHTTAEPTKSSGELLTERAEELIAQCHPLGLFDALPALTVGGMSAEEAQHIILQEAPIGRFFVGLNSDNFEVLRAKIWRRYLEDFVQFCQRRLDSASDELMHSVLCRESERRTLAIAINSARAVGLSKEERWQLFPRLGTFHEQGIGHKLAQTEDIAAIRTIIDSHPTLAGRFSTVGLEADDVFPYGTQNGSKLEECLAREEMQDCKETFEHPTNYAVFYAWCRLKEQECRNIVWIAECISQNRKGSVHEYIPLW